MVWDRRVLLYPAANYPATPLQLRLVLRISIGIVDTLLEEYNL
jgi:hypothetical protein